MKETSKLKGDYRNIVSAAKKELDRYVIEKYSKSSGILRKGQFEEVASKRTCNMSK